jgi:hypothetical protein
MNWLFIFLLSTSARAEMIFLDLNDAPQEIAACREGVQTANMRSERNENLHIVNPKARPRQRGEDSYKSDTYHALRAKIVELRSRGVPIDSIVISGEDGSGEFFGSQGKLPYHEFHALVREFPDVEKTLKTAAVWGCYTTTVNGSEQYWLNRMPNMQFTMGFTTQGPNKTRPGNHALLKQFCERRQEAAQATTMDALCRFYESLKQITTTSVAVCNRLGIATAEYSATDKCLTYQELHRRCPNFINDARLQGIYDKYMSGDQEPPIDDENKLTDLRKYYNEVNKWRHCARKYRTARGTDMPFPPNLIRLIKYKKVKENLARLNRNELEDYDQALENGGLSAFKVGDITKLSRRQLNDRIMGAVAALEGQSVEVPASRAPARRCEAGGFLFSGCENEPAGSTRRVRAAKDPVLLRMAQCMRQTFIQMNHECIPFDNVAAGSKTQSGCLLNYDEAHERSEDDPC